MAFATRQTSGCDGLTIIHVSEPYRVFKRGPGTMTSARNCNGVWLQRVEDFGKAEMLGELDSEAAAESRAAELLATDRFASYLICQGNKIVGSVSDTASQEELSKRSRRTEKWVKLIMVGLFVAASWFIWRKTGLSWPSLEAPSLSL